MALPPPTPPRGRPLSSLHFIFWWIIVKGKIVLVVLQEQEIQTTMRAQASRRNSLMRHRVLSEWNCCCNTCWFKHRCFPVVLFFLLFFSPRLWSLRVIANLKPRAGSGGVWGMSREDCTCPVQPTCCTLHGTDTSEKSGCTPRSPLLLDMRNI